MTANLLPASRYRIMPFTVSRPETISEAAALISTGGVPMAGGTDLVDRMKQGQVHSRLLSLLSIAELRKITSEDGALYLGAAVTHRMVSQDSLVREIIPSLSAFFAVLGNPRIRDRGTLGGNVMANEPGYEVAAALAALDASAEFLRTDGVRYVVPVLHAAKTNDLLVRFRVPDIREAEFYWDRSHRDKLTLFVGQRGAMRVIVLPTPGRAMAVTSDDVLRHQVPGLSRYASHLAATLLRRMQ